MAAKQDLQTALLTRSEGSCELCGSVAGLSAFEVPASPEVTVDQHILCCETCLAEINSNKPNANHWACLKDSMWSQVPAVQVMAWRLLKRHGSESWANEALDMLYLDEEVLVWAEAGLSDSASDDDLDLKHVDSNGTVLSSGDTVVLIKDLNVKGAGFTAKRGTAVRSIGLSPVNAAHIEGRVNGQQIVILTEFVKKS